jgi:hypothetical protein
MTKCFSLSRDCSLGLAMVSSTGWFLDVTSNRLFYREMDRCFLIDF